MRGKRLFRRLRALLARKKAAKSSGSQRHKRTRSTGTESFIVHYPQTQDGQSAAGQGALRKAAASLDEMRATAHHQDLSPFFNRLPLELRRKIYLEVWRAYLKPRRLSASHAGTDLRLHLYTPSSASTRLMHTRCTLHPDDPAQEDSFVTRPWPFDNYGTNPPAAPPGWFFEAWVLRLNWGKHWKCQHAVQKRWDPLAGDGSHSGGERAPFLPLFLACKTMSVAPFLFPPSFHLS